jgi:hypothetical protein
METEGKLRLADVFVSISDPRQAVKVEHDLVELLVVAVNAVLVGADTFVKTADAHRIGTAIRSHWSVENRLHWSMDVSLHDDQMRARSKAAAHNLAVLKHITLNLIRLDPVKRKGGIKARRLIATTSDNYRAELFGLK